MRGVVAGWAILGWQDFRCKRAWLAHRHNRLSVRPLLVWHVGRHATNEGASIVYTLRNVGLGPAVITDRYFTRGDERFSAPEAVVNEVAAFVKTVFEDKTEYRLRSYGLPGRHAALPSQAHVVVSEIFFPGARLEQLPELEELAGKTNFHVKYECMYGQAFVFDAAGGHLPPC